MAEITTAECRICHETKLVNSDYRCLECYMNKSPIVEEFRCYHCGGCKDPTLCKEPY